MTLKAVKVRSEINYNVIMRVMIFFIKYFIMTSATGSAYKNLIDVLYLISIDDSDY